MEPSLGRNRGLMLAAGLAALLFCLWLAAGRYDFIAAGDGHLYRGDRWTGEMVYVEQNWAFPVRLFRAPQRQH